MYILIDENLPELAEEVRAEVLKKRPNDLVLPTWIGGYKPEDRVSVVEPVSHISASSHTAIERHDLLNLASLGVRYWHDGDGDPLNPTYAGKPESAQKIVVDAAYAEMRAAYVRSFGVTYLGRTYVAPRTVILVDSESLWPEEGSDAEKILKNIPVGKEGLSPWSSFGLASAPDLRRLRKFVDDHWDTNFLAYSTKDKNRLKKIGVPFGEISKPVDEPGYGIEIRSVAALQRPYENSNIDFSIEVPNS